MSLRIQAGWRAIVRAALCAMAVGCQGPVIRTYEGPVRLAAEVATIVPGDGRATYVHSMSLLEPAAPPEANPLVPGYKNVWAKRTCGAGGELQALPAKRIEVLPGTYLLICRSNLSVSRTEFGGQVIRERTTIGTGRMIAELKAGRLYDLRSFDQGASVRFELHELGSNDEVSGTAK